jgi:hypothetical protein
MNSQALGTTRSGEQGMALVSLLVILSALTILSMGLIVFSSTEVRIADNQKRLIKRVLIPTPLLWGEGAPNPQPMTGLFC